MKNPNTYRFTIEDITDSANIVSLQFEMQDRENLLSVITALKEGSGLDEQNATRVGVALRLLGPVMVQHKSHPLFVDFMSHFKVFMMKLKKTTHDNSNKE